MQVDASCGICTLQSIRLVYPVRPRICSSSIAQLFAMMHLSKSTIPFPPNSLYTLQPLRSALIARSGHPLKVDPIA